MKNPDALSHLRNAVENTVPNVLNNILSQCDDRKGKVIEMKAKENKTKPSWVKPLVSAAAAIALLAGGVFGTGYYQRANAVYSVVTLDVNPSIEIKANKDDVVLDVQGLNEDAENLLSKQEDEGKKLQGEDLETVAKELASKMAEEGYLTELKNSVLVSVQNQDAEKSGELESLLMEGIKEALAEKGIDGAVLGQTLTENEDLRALAEELGISFGKAELISSVIENYPDLSYEELAGLSINDLLLIVSEWANSKEGMNLIGTPSDSEYVNARLAIEDACVNAGLVLGQVLGTEASFSYADGKLVYDVKVNIGDTSINCNVDAKNAEMESLISAIAEAAAKGIDQKVKDSGQSGTANDYEKVLTEAISGAISKAAENAQSGDGSQSLEQSLKQGLEQGLGQGLEQGLGQGLEESFGQGLPDMNETVTGIINSGIDYFKNSSFKG